jgi:hypothetical protein
MILITGGSWSCGEWAEYKSPPSSILKQREVTHTGLTHYINESKKSVINLGYAGIGNFEILGLLKRWINCNNHVNIEKILFFQTEYTRDYDRGFFQEDYFKIVKCDTIQNIAIERFYNCLSEFQNYTKIKIHLIGSSSDTYDPDIVKRKFNIDVVCQSFVNLLLNNSSTLPNPVFTWFTGEQENFIREIKQRINNEELKKFIDNMDQSFNRQELIKNNTRYFWPDGLHPNRHGHKVLYDFLVNKNIL